METQYQRKSIIHIQNIFLTNPIDVYVKRNDNRYIIGYEPKRYREHYLVFKISKELINNYQFDTINKVQINVAVDINVREEYRLSIKANDQKWKFETKNVTMRIIPTRYANFETLYGMVYKFNYRKTGAGGVDEIKFNIPECPTITNSSTINNICYKLVGKQISSGGTHQLHTYLLIAPRRGNFAIGNHINISNINNGGHRNMHTYPVVVTL